MSTSASTTPGTLQEQWRAVWPQALASWSTYTMLREPVFFESDKEAAAQGMAGQIAAIRLIDQSVMVNLETVPPGISRIWPCRSWPMKSAIMSMCPGIWRTTPA